MNAVPANFPLPFEITAYDQRTDLHAAVKIFDVTGSSPVLVATVPMQHLLNGTYFANYKPVGGRAFVANVAFYQDDTYASTATDYSTGSSSFATIASASSSRTS